MACDLISYLDKHFPALSLGGALFYSWPIGLRFNLGGRVLTSEDFAEVHRRATALFEAVFVPGDSCIVVSLEWLGRDTLPWQTHLSPLSEFAANHAVALREPSGSVQILEADDEDTGPYTLTWYEQSARDFGYGSILNGIANADHGREPAPNGWIYFINPKTNVIMHMYDDRGLDVIAKTKEPLASLYREFNTWLLDYDRNRIDATFRDVDDSARQ